MDTAAPSSRRNRYRPTLERFEGRTLLTTFTVNALADTGTGQGTSGDLRYCLAQANGNNERDTINFAVDGTIQLRSPLPAITSGRGVTIDGPGATALTIRGAGPSASFTSLRVKLGGVATIEGVTFADGHTTQLGGAIVNGGTLTLRQVTFVGNSAGFSGGAIHNTGPLRVEGSTFLNNTAGASGGGIYTLGPVTMVDSTMVGNRGESSGGAIESTFSVSTITRTTISDNSAGFFGGAISVNGPRDLTNRGGDLTITDSTIQGNMVGRADNGGFGGAIAANDSVVRINGTTLTGNSADRLAGGVGINGGNLIINGSTFTGNRTNGGGGAIAMNGGHSLFGMNITQGATLNVVASTLR